jgi:Tol biopolymer transport system component
MRFVFVVTIVWVIVAFSTMAQTSHATNVIQWELIDSKPVTGVAWSPDNRRLAAGLAKGVGIVIWNVETRTTESIISLTSPIHNVNDSAIHPISLAWSPNGDYISAISENTAYLINVETNQILWSLEGRNTEQYFIDSRWINSGQELALFESARLVHFVDIETGDITETFDLGFQYQAGTSAFDWSETARRYAIVDETSSVWLWDENGAPLVQFNRQSIIDRSGCLGTTDDSDHIHSVDWSPNGNMIAVAGSGLKICTFDELVGVQNVQLEMIDEPILSNVSWSPDGRWIVTNGFTTFPTGREIICLVRLYSVSFDYTLVDGRNDLGCGGSHNLSFRWSSDSRYIAFGSLRGLWIGTIVSN